MIDFRDHDHHELVHEGKRAPKPKTSADIALEYSVDLRAAQKARDELRAQGMRIPLTDAEAQAIADEWARGQG